LISLLFFAASIVANYYANIYALKKSSNAVTDILLSILPVINTNLIFVEGSLVFIAFIAILLAREPKAIPFVLKSVALFVVIRSFFVILTHFGPFPDRAVMDDYNFISSFTSSADLFFSGHTGMPFLFALIFWRQKILRYIFLASSIIAGASVLLAHYHYSIDVASAFFISFGVFHIAIWLFKKDYTLFLLDEMKY
jgi:membrane-associated phospholipid phosphatase